MIGLLRPRVALGRTLLLAALVPAGAFGCHEGTTSAGCDLCTTSATVGGTVRDSLGSPAAGALVGLRVFADSCNGPPVSVIPSGVLVPPTDSTGRYRYVLRTPRAPFAACVSAHAMLVTDTMIAVDTAVVGQRLRFQDDYPAGGPHDSVTIDLVLRHR